MTEGGDCDYGDVEKFNQWTNWDSYPFSSISVKTDNDPFLPNKSRIMVSLR